MHAGVAAMLQTAMSEESGSEPEGPPPAPPPPTPREEVVPTMAEAAPKGEEHFEFN